MNEIRRCARANCPNPAVATMTFNYRSATAVVGALAKAPVPGALDLCAQHVQLATVPVGWQLVKLQADYQASSAAVAKAASDDGLTALMDALRESEAQAQKEREKEEKLNRRARATVGLRNPWESHIAPPAPPRPRLVVIDGGAEK